LYPEYRRKLELLEGDSRHIGYIGIMDQLTKNEENRLNVKVKKLTEEKDQNIEETKR
jgi:hypothetical protein